MYYLLIHCFNVSFYLVMYSFLNWCYIDLYYLFTESFLHFWFWQFQSSTHSQTERDATCIIVLAPLHYGRICGCWIILYKSWLCAAYMSVDLPCVKRGKRMRFKLVSYSISFPAWVQLMQLLSKKQKNITDKWRPNYLDMLIKSFVSNLYISRWVLLEKNSPRCENIKQNEESGFKIY